MTSEEEVARLHAAELDDMREHWDGAYSFTEHGDKWYAFPLRPGAPVDPLIADSADELRVLVRADYPRYPRYVTGPKPTDQGSA